MRRSIAGLLLVLAACAPARDGGDRPAVVAPSMLQPPSIYALLGYRSQLGLTSEQVEALDSIAEDVRRRTGPALDDLRQRVEENPRSRGFLVLDDEVRPLVEQVRQENRAAVEAVQAVLTEEQRGTVCRLYQSERRRGRRGEDRREELRPQGVRGVLDDSTLVAVRQPWRWCGEDPATADGVAGQNARPRSK